MSNFETTAVDRLGRVFVALQAQVVHAKRFVPAMKNIYSSLDPSNYHSLSALLSALPVLRRKDIGKVPPLALIPTNSVGSRDRIFITRSTSGSSGNAPVRIAYSYRDWVRALRVHELLFVKRLRKVSTRLISYNNYHQSHISGPVFSHAMAVVGALPIDRAHGMSDADALDEALDIKANIFISPPTSHRKGGTIEGLLDADAGKRRPYLIGEHVKLLVVSSSILEDKRGQNS